MRCKTIISTLFLLMSPNYALSSQLMTEDIRFDLSGGTYYVEGTLEYYFDFPWAREDAVVYCESDIEPDWCNTSWIPEKFNGFAYLFLSYTAVAGPDGITFSFLESLIQPHLSGGSAYAAEVVRKLNEAEADFSVNLLLDSDSDWAGTFNIPGLNSISTYANSGSLFFKRNDQSINNFSFRQTLDVYASTHLYRVVDLAPQYGFVFDYRGEAQGSMISEYRFLGNTPPIANQSIGTVPLPASISGMLMGLLLLSFSNFRRIKRSYLRFFNGSPVDHLGS